MSPFARLSNALSGLFPRWGGYGQRASMAVLLPGATRDYEKVAGDLWRNSVVALSLAWLSDRFPRVPMKVSRIAKDGTYQPLPRSPLVDLWSRPNPYYTRRAMETTVALSLKIDGNSYVQKVRNGAGVPVELWWLPHFNVYPVWPDDGSAFISGYEVWVDGARHVLPPEDVIHFRTGIDPYNTRLGLSPLKACLREVVTVNEASGYTASLLRNSAVPGLMIVPDDPSLSPSPEDAERIKGRISQAFSGDERGSTVVLAGKYSVKPVGFSPEQLQLKELPASAQAVVSSALGVSLMSMGMPDPNKTYSNLAESNRSSWSTIQAIQDIIAESLRWSLMEDLGIDPMGHVVEYDYAEVNELQESLDSLHTRVRDDFKAKIITKNEARDLVGMEPVQDGDEFDSEPAPMLPGMGQDQPPKRVPVGSNGKGWHY